MRRILLPVLLTLPTGCIYPDVSTVYGGGTLTVVVTGSGVLPDTPLVAAGHPNPERYRDLDCYSAHFGHGLRLLCER